MKEVLNVGVIGLGNRGSNLLENCILPQPGVRVLADNKIGRAHV